MRIENLLDLPREELLAAPVDHFFEPAHDPDVAGRVELPEIAGAEPPVGGEELGVRLRVLVISEVNRRPFGRDLALGPHRNVTPCLVDQSEPEAGGYRAHGSRYRLGVVAEARVRVEARLEHSVQLDQMTAHAGAELADRLHRTRGAARDDHAQRGEVEPAELGLVQHRDDRGGRRGNVGHPLALDQLERGPGAELVEEDRPRSRHHRLNEREVAPVETERQVNQEHLVLGDALSSFSVRQVDSVVLWLWITPLGLPVVPEVKAIRMTSLAPWPVPRGTTAPASSRRASSDTRPGVESPGAAPRTQTVLRSGR